MLIHFSELQLEFGIKNEFSLSDSVIAYSKFYEQAAAVAILGS